MSWTGGYGADAERDIAKATVRDFMAISRDMNAAADLNQWHLERLTAEGGSAVQIRVRSGNVRYFRRQARAAQWAAVRFARFPETTAATTQFVDQMIVEMDRLLERDGWAVDVDQPDDRRPEGGLPPLRGPPARQLSDVHAPCCGVPAPPISWRRTGVDLASSFPHVCHRRNSSPLRPPDVCGRAGAPSMIDRRSPWRVPPPSTNVR